MAENKQPSTKERLAAIVNGFDDFDSEMKIGTRVRLCMKHVYIYIHICFCIYAYRYTYI
jgi:hypothetical protein